MKLQTLIDDFRDSALRMIIFTVVMSSVFGSCMAPFGDFQTARMVGKGNVELEPFWSVYNWGYSHIGMHVDVGIAEKVDLRASYSAFGDFEEHVDIVSILSIAPKLSLKKDVVAFAMPLGTDLYNHIVLTEPTLLLTKPISKFVDLTIAPKSIFILSAPEGSDTEPILAVTLGLSFKVKGSPFTIRPECGYACQLKDFFDSDYAYGFGGIGISIRLGQGAKHPFPEM